MRRDRSSIRLDGLPARISRWQRRADPIETVQPFVSNLVSPSLVLPSDRRRTLRQSDRGTIRQEFGPSREILRSETFSEAKNTIKPADIIQNDLSSRALLQKSKGLRNSPFACGGHSGTALYRFLVPGDRPGP